MDWGRNSPVSAPCAKHKTMPTARFPKEPHEHKQSYVHRALRQMLISGRAKARQLLFCNFFLFGKEKSSVSLKFCQEKSGMQNVKYSN